MKLWSNWNNQRERNTQVMLHGKWRIHKRWESTLQYKLGVDQTESLRLIMSVRLARFSLSISIISANKYFSRRKQKQSGAFTYQNSLYWIQSHRKIRFDVYQKRSFFTSSNPTDFLSLKRCIFFGISCWIFLKKLISF